MPCQRYMFAQKLAPRDGAKARLNSVNMRHVETLTMKAHRLSLPGGGLQRLQRVRFVILVPSLYIVFASSVSVGSVLGRRLLAWTGTVLSAKNNRGNAGLNVCFSGGGSLPASLPRCNACYLFAISSRCFHYLLGQRRSAIYRNRRLLYPRCCCACPATAFKYLAASRPLYLFASSCCLHRELALRKQIGFCSRVSRRHLAALAAATRAISPRERGMELHARERLSAALALLNARAACARSPAPHSCCRALALIAYATGGRRKEEERYRASRGSWQS